MNSLTLTPEHLPRKDDLSKIKLESAEDPSPVTEEGSFVMFLKDSDEVIGDEEPLFGAESDPLALEYPGGLNGIIWRLATQRCSRL